MWHIVNPGGTGQARECRIEAQPGLTVNGVLRRLAEIGVIPSSKDSLPEEGTKVSSSGTTGSPPLVEGLNLTIACDDRVLDPAKRLEEDYLLSPGETTLYITSLPYAQPLRLFVVRVESGETTVFEMWAEDKAVELQRQIRHRLGVDQDDLLLVHKGEMIDLEKSFSEQFIATEASIYLLFKSQEPPLPAELPGAAARGQSGGTGEAN